MLSFTFRMAAWLHYAFAIECDAIGQRLHKQALLARLEQSLYESLYGMAPLVRCTMNVAGAAPTSIMRSACWRAVLSIFARRFTLR